MINRLQFTEREIKENEDGTMLVEKIPASQFDLHDKINELVNAINNITPTINEIRKQVAAFTGVINELQQKLKTLATEYGVKVEDLNLVSYNHFPWYIQYRLRDKGIKTVGQLKALTKRDVLTTPGLGNKAWSYINQYLEEVDNAGNK